MKTYQAARDLGGLAVFLLVCLAVSGVGGAITATSVGDWYQELAKPAFNPPDWVFAPVWTALYIMMAVAGWRVWRKGSRDDRRAAMTLFALQLVLNLVWSLLFFGLQQVGAAVIEILALLLAIAATAVVFGRIDRVAGLLFVPYLLWVAYATILNISIWVLN